jgi:hypothetical protein
MRGTKAKMLRRVAADLSVGADEYVEVNVHQKQCGVQRVVLEDGTALMQPVFHEVSQRLWAADSARCMYKQLKREVHHAG